MNDYDETVKALNDGAKLPDVRKESRRPTSGVVIVVAALIGVMWQQAFEAFPGYQPFVHSVAIAALVLLNRWARSE